MKLLIACALLATASAIITKKSYDNPWIVHRSITHFMSAYIPQNQCSGWISEKALGCSWLGVGQLNVSVSSNETVDLDLHQGQQVTIYRHHCTDKAEVNVALKCGAIWRSDSALPEVPLVRRHALLPLGHQDPAPFPPAPNSY